MRRHLLHVVVALATVLGSGATRAEELRQVLRYRLEGEFRHVLGFDVDRQGNLVVVDSERPAILRFDPKGRRTASHTQSGKRYCETSSPTAVTMTADGYVVYDIDRQYLLLFNPRGECQSDQRQFTFQAGAGGLTSFPDQRLVGAGSLMKKARGERCVFFSTDAYARSPKCLLNITDDSLWLLYGREYTDASATTAYFMVPYEPVLYVSDGSTPAHAARLQGLGLQAAVLPSDEHVIRADRALAYAYYNQQSVVEGVGALRSGAVVAVRTPGTQHRIDLRYFKNGSVTASASTSFSVPPVVGGYLLHIRGDGTDRVYVLLASGKYPALRYEAVVYQLR